jgi:hypothetical protein
MSRRDLTGTPAIKLIIIRDAPDSRIRPDTGFDLPDIQPDTDTENSRISG